ncbi:MAG TPA: ATP-binding cassette domain-containing protein [Kofleriaceae bacterium]|jgi:molybdate transport system ATP-binding protein
MGASLVAALHVRRGEFVLDVALDAPPGVTAVMGASGSGKSTLLGALAGLIEPAAGRIALGAEVWFERALGARPQTDVRVEARRLAYVAQGLALFPHMTALANVLYGMAPGPRAARHDRAHALLGRLGVAHLAARRPATFSGGEAQRVALARALARQPELVLLDEPFSALDPTLRADLANLVRELVAELAVPAIHVTHSPEEAQLISDRIIRIDRGRIAQ